MNFDPPFMGKSTPVGEIYFKKVSAWIVDNFGPLKNGSKLFAKLASFKEESVSHRTAELYIKGARVPPAVTIAILEARRPDLAAILQQEREKLRELLSKDL